MNRHQITILKELNENKHYLNVTNFLESLSEKHDVSLSTLRWNIRILKELELIECGGSEKKGLPVKLTESRKLVCKIIDQVEGDINE